MAWVGAWERTRARRARRAKRAGSTQSCTHLMANAWHYVLLWHPRTTLAAQIPSAAKARCARRAKRAGRTQPYAHSTAVPGTIVYFVVWSSRSFAWRL